MAEITLNCLIVPIGKLMNIPCIKVMQAITIEKVRSNNEKVMDRCANISDYFTEKPKAEHFYITAGLVLLEPFW
ncbi:hypothetical protein RhiirA4_483998 [Rhizophagus irregularis]|uniref:Uncharacterized protein n=1 Tax=Rhizophagus irregularis TaxID=588596 RepID=A0A2I1HNB4_9GLOM|nr:hypothetical protein RhiirA4_483998 [Rhizophagus irregularis]